MEAQLRQAIALAQAGQRAEARRLLLEIVAVQPGMETAWLWLATVADSQKERVDALVSVLAINPHNTQARNALEKLGQPVPEYADTAPFAPPKLPRERAENAISGRILILAGVLIALILIAAVFISSSTETPEPPPTLFSPTDDPALIESEVEALNPTDTPPPTAIPLPTNTPGPSPTPIPPITLAPTWTPEPSRTPPPTRTIAPTSTPLPTRTPPPTFFASPTLEPSPTQVLSDEEFENDLGTAPRRLLNWADVKRGFNWPWFRENP